MYKDLTKKEEFDTTDDIKAAVKTLYNADIQAIRNLSDIATKLVAGGLTVPGNILLQMNNVIDFGSNDTTREGNAGKIGYGTFGDNLSIVGKGNPGEPRRIRLWDNVDVGTNMYVGGSTNTNGLNTTGSLNISEPTGHPAIIGSLKNQWLINTYPNENFMGFRGFKDDAWTDFNLLIDNLGNVSVKNQLRTPSVKIGSWTIQEDNGHLQFIKDGTPYTKGNSYYFDVPADTGFSAIAQDGNIWNNRSNGRGWVGDNLEKKVNK